MRDKVKNLERTVGNEYLILPSLKLLAKKYQTCVVMPVFNRPAYLRRCLVSLSQSAMSQTLLMFLDDCSDDLDAIALMNNFHHPQAASMRIRRVQRTGSGILDGLHHNFMFAFNYACAHFDCSYFCILDSDMIVKPNWLTVLQMAHASQRDKDSIIVSGFNTLRHPVLKEHGDHYHKASLGGANMFFTPRLWSELFLPLETYWDDVVNRRMQLRGYRLVCVKPSVVQHIGRSGAFSLGSIFCDRAFDFGVSPWVGKLLYYLIERPILALRSALGRVKRQLMNPRFV